MRVTPKIGAAKVQKSGAIQDGEAGLTGGSRCDLLPSLRCSTVLGGWIHDHPEHVERLAYANVLETIVSKS